MAAIRSFIFLIANSVPATTNIFVRLSATILSCLSERSCVNICATLSHFAYCRLKIWVTVLSAKVSGLDFADGAALRTMVACFAMISSSAIKASINWISAGLVRTINLLVSGSGIIRTTCAGLSFMPFQRPYRRPRQNRHGHQLLRLPNLNLHIGFILIRNLLCFRMLF